MSKEKVTTNNAGGALVHSSPVKGLNTPANASPRSPAPQTTLETEVHALKHSLRKIRRALFEQANDTIWISQFETAVDRINAHLEEECSTLEECEEADA